MQRKKARGVTQLVVGAAFGAWLFATPSLAFATTDPLIEGAKLCTKVLPQYEKQFGIPAHLLSAIAATESGRYHKDLKIRIPWPWTINAEGKGYYLDSKEEAIAKVRSLMRQGVQSIDVGCMQVNLYHHSQAFSSLEQAFDPRYNVAYAATFLRTLYNDTSSWKQAAADYHSKTPGKGNKYVGMVYDSWQRLVDKLQVAQLKVPETSLAEMRDMQKQKANSGLVYANTLPKPVTTKLPVAKTTPLGGQVGRQVAAYQPPRMNTVEVSKKTSYKENGVIVVKPEIQPQPEVQASVAPVMLDTSVLKNDGGSPSEGRANGPNFIFSN